MQRNRWGLNRSIIICFISRLCVCCVAFQRCRHIYRNNARLSTLLSQLAVAIIMTTRNYAIIDLIGVCCETVSSLLLRTTNPDRLLSGVASQCGNQDTQLQSAAPKTLPITLASWPAVAAPAPPAWHPNSAVLQRACHSPRGKAAASFPGANRWACRSGEWPPLARP